MKPILKYRGGKSKEIDMIMKYVPSNYNRYIEPFVGGGALFFYLEPKNGVINDINDKLIECYQNIRDNYEKIRVELDELECIYIENQKEYLTEKMKNQINRIPNKNEPLYYKIREMFNKKEINIYEWATIYYFINKTAYSGMIRYNRKGEYNVPYGRYDNFNTKLLTKEHHELLQHTKIHNLDYKKVFDLAKKDDFLFLDPPYDCIFNSYGNEVNENTFHEEQQIDLAKEFKQLESKALMVIGKTDLIENLYKGYIREEYDKTYGVNIKNRFNRETKHLIISNY